MVNPRKLIEQMLSVAMKEVTENDWNQINATVEAEFSAIVDRIAEIQRRAASGEISEEGAERLFQNQVGLMHSALYLDRVLKRLAVQRLVNTVFNAIGGIVNQWVGFELIEVED